MNGCKHRMVLCKSLFENEPEIKKVKVNRVDAKPLSNYYEGDVLVNNLLRGKHHGINSKENEVLHASVKFVETY